MKKPKPPAVQEPAFIKGCGKCLSGYVTVWRQREGFVPLPSVVRCECWLKREETHSEPARKA